MAFVFHIKIPLPPPIWCYVIYSYDLILIDCCSRCNCFNSAARRYEKTAECWRKLHWGWAWGIHAITQEADDWFPMEAECSWYWSHTLPRLPDGWFIHSRVSAFFLLYLFSWIYLLLKVLQDSNAKKEELCLRGRGLKTLGKIFQVSTPNDFINHNHCCYTAFCSTS